MVTVARIGKGEPPIQAPYPLSLRVELPEGYVPPEPTHPF